MKTRVLFTKTWKDGYFRSLNSIEKLLFIYFFTNEYVNQLWFYECPEDVIAFETFIPIEKVKQIKQKFQADKKIFFYKDHVYLVNAHKYEKYRGQKNEIGKQKIFGLLNTDLFDWYKNVVPDKGIDTRSIPSITHNSEHINNNSENLFNNTEHINNKTENSENVNPDDIPF